MSTESERIEAAVSDLLTQTRITYETVYLSTGKDGDWEHDRWEVQFLPGDKNKQLITEFRTGLGLRKARPGLKCPWPRNTLGWLGWQHANVEPVAPARRLSAAQPTARCSSTRHQLRILVLGLRLRH